MASPTGVWMDGAAADWGPPAEVAPSWPRPARAGERIAVVCPECCMEPVMSSGTEPMPRSPGSGGPTGGRYLHRRWRALPRRRQGLDIPPFQG
jgi:hypothetical protein